MIINHHNITFKVPPVVPSLASVSPHHPRHVAQEAQDGPTAAGHVRQVHFLQDGAQHLLVGAEADGLLIYIYGYIPKQMAIFLLGISIDIGVRLWNPW